MSGNFRDMCDEFNKSAKVLPRSGRSADILLTRFELLLKHRAETDDEKRELVQSLYDCGKDCLKPFGGQKGTTWIGDSIPGNVDSIFTALCAPESLKYIPETAPRELADIALDLLTKADTASDVNFSNYTRYEGYVKHMVSFARTALKTADAARAEIEGREVDIKTGKAISPAKRLILKQPGDQK